VFFGFGLVIFGFGSVVFGFGLMVFGFDSVVPNYLWIRVFTMGSVVFMVGISSSLV